MENVSEVFGWCYNHGSPVFDGESPFCRKLEDCGLVVRVAGVWMCDDCNTIYDDKKMTNWNWGDTWYGNCPVGRELAEEEPEETPEEYADKLKDKFSEYDESRVEECLSEGFYTEAIVFLHRHIFEQLRYMLAKRIKGTENIPMDEEDPRYKKITKLLKRMKDFSLNDFAFIYKRIDEGTHAGLGELNSLRNTFVHAWNREDIEEKYPDRTIQKILKHAIRIEKKLKRRIDDMEGGFLRT